MLGVSSAVITLNGKELELVGGLEVFNDYENVRHLGKVKAAKVTNQVTST